ncbi:hypothetical protein [Pseudomonas cremoricolorata]|uniref:capsular polysaccharide export protein, LipB/KpsS family n=1 Tax=Pseudomonas cremoricolorata TaxID=157783 RepID=UPI00040BB085|nr:hypothetical protein [Pseudomonas cremoricolorata]
MGIGSTLYTAPKRLILNALRSARQGSGITHTYVVGFSNWKQYLRSYFPDREFHFLPKEITAQGFSEQWSKKILKRANAEFFVWGYKAPQFISDFAAAHGKPVTYVEDGFIRSVKLGASLAPARSLTLDKRTPYFNAQAPSELEELLQNYDFSADPALLERAKKAIVEMLRLGISKYNSAPSVDMHKLYGAKQGKRVLVLGQVEDDASILLGCERKITNNDLVRLAHSENPGAQIIYKPHPDVLSGKRAMQSDPADVKNIALIVKKDVPMPLSFHEVDHVYTITSLGGFEALLRGIKVTAFGCPFYAGWGVTDDRQPNSRRTRKLTVAEIFAIAYLRYAQYYDLTTGQQVQHEDVVQAIAKEMGGIPRSISSGDSTAAAPATQAAAKKKPSSAIAHSDSVTPWFNPRPGPQLRAALEQDKPLFLYMPWIAGHGDALLEKLRNPEAYVMAGLDIVPNVDAPGVRVDVMRFANKHPAVFRKMLINRLVPIRNRITCMLFTFDWLPAMRMLSSVCEELQIPRILIPHESVFVDRSKYYWDSATHASTPLADQVLGWGGLQKEIFCERGYPEDRFLTVGAPKFDGHATYSPVLSRAQFCQIFGLDPDRKIILFASQPLDSQVEMRAGQQLQRNAIGDLLSVADELGAQVLLRMPPNKMDILDDELRQQFSRLGGAIDDGAYYSVPPEEALYHSALVSSINSTMLFEALLMNRPALSLKYFEFEQIWADAGIPAVVDIAGLRESVGQLLNGDWQRTEEGMQWAAHMFGVGAFDGGAAGRIKAHLSALARDPHSLQLRSSAVERLFRREPIDVVAIPSHNGVITGIQKYVQPMLGARTLLSTRADEATVDKFSGVDIFFQWGITESTRKSRQRDWAKSLGKPIVYIEDGFIRSLDIGLSQEPGMSIIMDDKTSYYDATKPSRLEQLYEFGPQLSAGQVSRARSAIDLIVSSRVSKYNHAPDVPFNLGEKGRKKVLLVDQRFGDQSVASGLGDEKSFEYMLQDVLTHRSDCDILIKQHPDAIKGGKSSYFSNERLAITQYMDNVYPILFDINPFALFDIVDEVYVVTSGMGFEALMAGKTVHCYGVPFYSGWGLTVDQKKLERRTRERSLEDLFHFAYIECSRYFHPGLDRVAEVEEVVQYIKEKKAER